MYKVTSVSSKNIFGTMNTGTVKLSNLTSSDRELIMHRHNLTTMDGLTDKDITREDKSAIFSKHRKELGEAFGFDGAKMFMADQVDKTGSYFEITPEYVEQNPKGWTDINQDILVITDKVPGVVVGHPVADCPVVMMVDEKNGVAAIGHCSAEMIDKKLPIMIAKALEEYGSELDDIEVLVSACAGPNWTYDSYPKWATNSEVWKDCIIEVNGEFKIDLRKAIKKQLDSKGLKNVTFNMDDTITNDLYYSNSEGRIRTCKIGRQFEGLYFNEESRKK